MFDFQVYIVAGGTLNGRHLKSTEILKPGAHSWREVEPLPRSLYAASLANIDGLVYLLGIKSFTNINSHYSFRVVAVSICHPCHGRWIQ